MKKQFIEIKTDFEAIHNWPECPFSDVSFLKNPHRHKIYIKIKIETRKDRQIEFFQFKSYVDILIDEIFGTERVKQLGRRSMEEICNMLLDVIISKHKFADITISASEDNQVAGIVEYTVA